MKKLFFWLAGLLAVVLLAFYLLLFPRLMIISGYAAKNMCSCVFVAGIPEDRARQEDLNFDIIGLADVEVDYKQKKVTATVWGMAPKTAWHLGPTGCALVNRMPAEQAYRYPEPWQVPRYDSLENWFEYIDTVEYLTAEQLRKLGEATDLAFAEDDPQHPKKNTRAVVVLHRGQLVAEKYAPGFGPESRLLGWSMTKSLTASALSLLIRQGRIDPDAPTGIAEWQGDERQQITWRHLLQMNSGLRWQEVYDEVSDAVLMLFNSDSIGHYAMQMPAERPPGTHWTYSSGTTNILAAAMHDYFPGTGSYIRFPYDSLFYRIGMYSLVLEADASGRFVGSSYGWATARDWARIGQLYLQNGNWAGVQLLDTAWVRFVQQPAPHSNDIYGGHFWLNKGGRYPDVPADTYSLDGFHGQKVFIIPSRELVVVRLGLTYHEPDFDFNTWLAAVIRAVE